MVDYIKKIYQYYLAADGISTDSRKITKNCLFFALKGDNFDGNKYAKKAIEEGARYAIVDDPKVKLGKPYILVKDALETLQLLAAHHRNQFDIPVIGITGSNGKTTTKELVQGVLSRRFLVHATKGNFNNHIGVPLTILDMPQDTEVAVIEMGASSQGEIAFLCNIANPTYGIVTNIGQSHLEGFGGIEGVIEGKGELYKHIAKNKGVVLYNVDEKYLAEMASIVDLRVGYGIRKDNEDEAFIQVLPINDTDAVVAKVPEDGWSYRVFARIAGTHNFENIKTAIVVGKYFKIPFVDIKNSIEHYVPKNMRSQTFRQGSNFIFLDAYNANPSSMKMALVAFDKMSFAQVNRIAVLGDMGELGAYEKEGHEAIFSLAQKMNFSKIILVGSLFAQADKQEVCTHFEDVQELQNWLLQNGIEDTVFFVKGSRSNRLEKAFLSDTTKTT